MLVAINGEPCDVDAPISVSALVDLLQLRGRIAVELNGEVVPRGEHSTRLLQSGDRIEIVRAIGGW